MKHYTARTDFKQAVADAANGGQALFTHNWGMATGSKCFHGAKVIGKLFDQNARRLEETARALGVRRVKIDRRDHPWQHVDLVGKPLERAIAMASEEGRP